MGGSVRLRGGRQPTYRGAGPLLSRGHADVSSAARVNDGAVPVGPRVIAVVVTHERPALLRACLQAIRAQERAPEAMLVVDNASGPETGCAVAAAGAEHLYQPCNLGGAGGYAAGIRAALERGADWIWLMDDDGRPAGPGCLATLLAAAERAGADIAAPLVLDADDPDRLAFPIRIEGRTRFMASEVPGEVSGFAHLFNGALVRAALLRRIGAPDPRFVVRGDEVEFLFRALHAGAEVLLDSAARFFHPGSAPEIHPIMGGLFYATLPTHPAKQVLQFRNRAWIFRSYGMWGWLCADAVRYGWFFLSRRDPRGLSRWAVATWSGLAGHFMCEHRSPAAPSGLPLPPKCSHGCRTAAKSQEPRPRPSARTAFPPQVP